ncbi:hypothetical protein E1200_19735 [Actinomadura sp. GC306]|uniref:hypothetical protein n=1 Tax=Actinomadura sp. GC306 TaxID=2530367 RepID=UPI0010434331|nr:hypothetical protein [Actinomadura sp. GC306]TDC64755.1 hypothetical protein E1200_19735 [Actinomadura sp. GC306]
MSATSRTARLVAGVPETLLARQLMPRLSAVGWPIPVRKRYGGAEPPVVALRLPLYEFAREGRGPTTLYPPFAALTLRWDDGLPVEYADFGFTRPWPEAGGPRKPAGTFPHPEVRGDLAAYKRDRAHLYGLYDRLCDSLRDGTPFRDAEEFAVLLRRLVEPGLEPYYRGLGERFFSNFLGSAD